MAKFLVVSYDPDQQQFFYDLVSAETKDAAKMLVCERREYVMDAEALTPDQLTERVTRLLVTTEEELSTTFDESCPKTPEDDL